MWSGGLDKFNAELIKTYCDQLPKITASLGYGGDTYNDAYRSSNIAWVKPERNEDPLNGAIIKDIMWDYVVLANRNAFGFDIDYLSDIQFTTYRADANGKYDTHIDTFWANPSCYDRKVSIVIQLSDPSTYDGGDFQFSSDYENPSTEDLRRQGTVLVFPSFLPHMVTPVTRGVRQSLVGWAEGPKFR